MKKMTAIAMVIFTAVALGCGEKSSSSPAWDIKCPLLVLTQPPGDLPGNIYEVCTDTGDVKNTNIQTGMIPNQVLLEGTKLYVVNSKEAALWAWDMTDTMKAVDVHTFAAGSNPWSVAVYAGRKAFVSLWMSHKVASVDLKTGVITEIDIPAPDPAYSQIKPFPLNLTIRNGKVYVALSAHDTTFTSYKSPGIIGVINAETGTYEKTISTDDSNCLAVNSVGFDSKGAMYALCAGNFGSAPGRVVVLENEAKAASIETGGSPVKIAFAPGDKAYLADSSGPNVFVIDTAGKALLKKIELPQKSSWFATSVAVGIRNTAYATVWDPNAKNNLFVIDTSTDTVLTKYNISGPAQDVIYIGAH
jgi:DNA-binding beta-propeller fold protein YncE